MDQLHLPLFLINIALVLLDASLGYHMAPRLLAGVDDPDAANAGIRASRGLIPAIVAVYMFFNCLGYFQARFSYLVTVFILLSGDLVLQLVMQRRRARNHTADEGDGE